jgi:hypothetical protein
MIWSRLWRLLALVLSIFAAGFFAPAIAADRPTASADRQILVMIHHLPDHYRANGAYGGGYGDELARSARERVARVIAHKYGLAFVEEWPMPMVGVDCFVMLVPDGRPTSAVAEQVSHDPDVYWAEPVELYTSRGAASESSPNDPLFATEPAAAQWRLADLHRMAAAPALRWSIAALTSATRTLRGRSRSIEISFPDSRSSLNNTVQQSPGSLPPRAIIASASSEWLPAQSCSASAPAGKAARRRHATRLALPRPSISRSITGLMSSTSALAGLTPGCCERS